jgi:hypothetical protein
VSLSLSLCVSLIHAHIRVYTTSSLCHSSLVNHHLATKQLPMPILTHFHMSQQPPRIVKKDVLAKHMHNTALSLSLLTLGHPNISCQSIQEYHHHFYPRMLLDSGDYTVDMGDHLVWAFSCLGNFRFFWVRQYNQSSSPSWKPAELDSGQTRPSSCYLPPSDVGMLNDMSCSQSMLSATQSTVDCLSGNL